MIDIAIIGGGPAGLAAGLYAARGGANAVLFEELFAGGQAAKTDRIENYPGFENGIEGAALGMQMQNQAVRFGLAVRSTSVSSLDLSDSGLCIHTAKGMEQARMVILAMGASPRKLNIPREEELTGAGVSYCATCDGAFFRGRDVAVVGGGDTALSDALYLARFAARVYIIHRRDALRGAKALQTAVFAEQKIEMVWNSVVTGLAGQQVLEAIEVNDVTTGETRTIPAAALFVAVGITPRTELVNGQLALTDAGYILTDSCMRTTVGGVFAAGDVRATPLRQVVTAVADGAIAASEALAALALGEAAMADANVRG